MTTESILELDGANSWVELPPDVFNGLEEATVESWVKWGDFRGWSRSLISVTREASMAVYNIATTCGLQFEISGIKTTRPRSFPFLAFASTNEWIPYRRRFRQGRNEALFQRSPYWRQQPQGKLRVDRQWPAQLPGPGQLARLKARSTPDFEGQMAEVRVWRTARSEQEIQENLFKKLTGSEAGLAALWNFDTASNSVVKDLGAGRS